MKDIKLFTLAKRFLEFFSPLVICRLETLDFCLASRFWFIFGQLLWRNSYHGSTLMLQVLTWVLCRADCNICSCCDHISSSISKNKTSFMHGFQTGIWILFPKFYHLKLEKLNFSTIRDPALFDYAKLKEIVQVLDCSV